VESRCCPSVVVVLLLQVSICFGGSLFSFSYVFQLCVSFMSRLALVILLLHRLGVIDSFLVLTYSLLSKNYKLELLITPVKLGAT
jgi:hypothetical protein